MSHAEGQQSLRKQGREVPHPRAFVDGLGLCTVPRPSQNILPATAAFRGIHPQVGSADISPLIL